MSWFGDNRITGSWRIFIARWWYFIYASVVASSFVDFWLLLCVLPISWLSLIVALSMWITSLCELIGLSLRIKSESGKMRTRKTPNTDNFYASKHYKTFIRLSWSLTRVSYSYSCLFYQKMTVPKTWAQKNTYIPLFQNKWARTNFFVLDEMQKNYI